MVRDIEVGQLRRWLDRTTGLLLGVSLLLTCASASHRLNNGPADVNGDFAVSGNLTVGGSVIAAKSVSGDTLTASRQLRAYDCLVSFGKILAQDSTRQNKGMYLGGQFVNRILRASGTLDFDMTALTYNDQTVSVPGSALGDEVFVGAPNGSITTTVQYTGWVSSAGTVTVRGRVAAIGENPASGTFKVVVFQ